MANFGGSFYILCSEYGWSKSIKEKILDLLSKYNLYPVGKVCESHKVLMVQKKSMTPALASE